MGKWFKVVTTAVLVVMLTTGVVGCGAGATGRPALPGAVIIGYAENIQSTRTAPLFWWSGGVSELRCGKILREPASLQELDGVISVYLPDLRYASNLYAEKYSQTPHYVEHARQAIKEMHRQVVDLKVDEYGVAQSGIIVRHLILPHGLAGTGESLTWLARELGSGVTVSLMAQYSPQNRASEVPELSRTISTVEDESALQALSDAGLENGWVQEMGASEDYLPDFEREDHPFIPAMEEGT